MRRVKILVCRGPECGDKRNSRDVHAAMAAALATVPAETVAADLDWQSCFGKCQRGVNVLVREAREGEDAFFGAFLTAAPGSALYNAVVPGEAARIVSEHVIGGRVVAAWKNRGT